MSSIILSVSSLILILSMRSNGDHFMRNTICEEGIDYIDGIVELKDYRYFILPNKLFEYDFEYNFRRRALLPYEVEYFDVMDKSRTAYGIRVTDGKFLSGFFIPEVDCTKLEGIEDNCTEIQNTMSNVSVAVIYNLFTNKYSLISKKYNHLLNTFVGIYPCSASETHESNETESRTSDNDPTYTECGPYYVEGRTTPLKWLLSELPYNWRHKFLPIFYDSEKLEIIIVLNKEYKMFGKNPALFRTQAYVYWKSIKYTDPAHGWKSLQLSNDYTYTAFLKDQGKVYLIAEPFRVKNFQERGPSSMFLFDLNTKTISEYTTKSPMALFGCSFESSNLIAYIFIGIMVLVLVLVICGWIFGGYWLYVREPNTTQTTSVRMENT